MKKPTFLLFLAILLLSACQGVERIEAPGIKALTPYILKAEGLPAQITSEPEADEVLLASPTATPMVHIIALGETISSVSLQYGVPMDVIIYANPEANPSILIVGDELIIPSSENGKSVVLDPAITEKMSVSDPNCTESRGNR